MKNNYKINFLTISKYTIPLLDVSNRLKILLILLILPISLFAQDIEDVKVVNAIVLNENNEPLSGVTVFSSNANKPILTSKDGSFTIIIKQDDFITLELNGYDTQSYSVKTISNTIRLKQKLPKPGQKNSVNIAFKKESSGNIVGQIGYINTDDFSDFDKSQKLEDIINGRVSGMFFPFNVRSLGTALLVIDGVPRSRTYLDNMNTMEVEQVTVLKGVHSVALYGEEASNGAVLITTKRGKSGRNTINTFIETGISVPKRKPNYLGAVEYMTLFNEALNNDGLNPRYSDEVIARTLSQDNPFRYPDIDYYSSEFVDDFSTNARVLTEFSGGKKDTRYYVHLGFNSYTDIVNIQNAGGGQNSFNLRANVDFRISDFLTANIDVVGYLNTNRSPNRNFFTTANNYLPNEFAPLIPASLIDDEDLLENAKLIDEQFLVGGTPNFSNNIYADYAFSGENVQTSQNFQFNNGLDFDLSSLVEGLTAKTYFSFDYFNTFQDRQQRTYAIYDATWTNGVDGEDILSVTKIGDDVAEPKRTVQNTDFTRNYGANIQINYSKDFGDNSFDATILGYHKTQQGNFQLFDNVYNHLGLRLNYDYKNKYIIDFSSSYATSRKLAAGNRGGFSPSIAFGWVASRESFFKNTEFIDYLKFNISAGINKSTDRISNYYLYQDSFNTSGTYRWNDGGRSGRITQLNVYGNPNLTYVERKEFNAGIEAVLFKSFGINASYFNTRFTGLPTQLNSIYTAFLGSQLPKSNHNENLYQGLDFGINYSKKIGNFSIQTGLTSLYVTNDRVKFDQVNIYQYLNREGKPADGIFGLEALGFFNNQDDILNSPAQQFGTVKPGDIKYKDQNGDNLIDNNDAILLGDSQPDLNYGVNLTLKYKGFSFFILGAGQAGGEIYDNSNYFWVSGNDKYSEIVRNRWTPQTAATATYPRLSSGENPNNFRNSSFWMRNSDYFKISRIQLTFDFPKQVVSNLKMRDLGLYVRGNNLFTISKNRDRIDLNSNSLQFHSFSLGVIANF